MKSLNARDLSPFILLFLALFPLSPKAQSATGLWMGSASHQTWNSPSNWTDNTVPGVANATGNTDTASFSSNLGPTHVELPDQLNLQHLHFGAGSGNYTLGASIPNTGGSLKFTENASITIDSGVANAQIVLNTPLHFSGSTNNSITNHSSSSTLSIHGAVNLDNTQLTLGGLGKGKISGALAGSTSTLRKIHSGTWEINDAQLFQGNILVEEGTLLINSPNGSGSGSTTVSGSATLGGTGKVTGTQLQVNSTSHLTVGHSHSLSSSQPTETGYTPTASALTLGNGDAYRLQINGSIDLDIFSNDAAIAQTEADRLIINSTAGNSVVNGTINVANASGTRYQFTAGEWQLFDFSTLQGASQSISWSPTLNLANDLLRIGYVWDSSQLATTGILRSVEDITSTQWTGGGGTTAWDLGANWSRGATPTKTDSVIFGAIATPGTSTIQVVHNPTVAADTQVKNILFTGERNYTIQMSKGTPFYDGSLMHSMGGTQTFNGALRSRVTESRILTDSGTLTISSINTNNATTWIVDGAGDTFIGSINRRFNVNVDLVKEGSGTLSITSFNTVDGDPAFAVAASFVRGKVTIKEGTLRIQDERSLGGPSLSFRSDQLTLDGGRFFSYGAEMILSNSNRGITVTRAGGTFGAENTRKLTIQTVITGQGSVTIQGQGDVTFSNSNTYTGHTTVVQGRFWVGNNLGSATGSGGLTVRSGGQLGGTGFVTPNSNETITIEQSGILLIGNNHALSSATASKLTLGATGANVDVNLLGTLKFDLTGAGKVTALGDSSYNLSNSNLSDQLTILTHGDINLQAAKLDLYATNTTGWAEGQSWKLIDWTQSNPASLQYSNIQLLNSSFGNFNLTTIITLDGLYVTIVPEPSKVILLLFGFISFVLRRRR